MSFSGGVDLVPKEVALALRRATARRAYVGKPVARGVLSCPLCHGRNVEAVKPEAGRGVNEIFETLLGSLVKGERKATAFSDGFAAMGLKLWRDAHIWKIGHEQIFVKPCLATLKPNVPEGSHRAWRT